MSGQHIGFEGLVAKLRRQGYSEDQARRIAAHAARSASGGEAEKPAPEEGAGGVDYGRGPRARHGCSRVVRGAFNVTEVKWLAGFHGG